MRSAIIAVTAVLLGACATGDSGVVVLAPALYDYAPEVQTLAADEIELGPVLLESGSLAPPCPRERVLAGCSALHLLIEDYGAVRAEIRAGRGL